jgi:hypothetical protein
MFFTTHHALCTQRAGAWYIEWKRCCYPSHEGGCEAEADNLRRVAETVPPCAWLQPPASSLQPAGIPQLRWSRMASLFVQSNSGQEVGSSVLLVELQLQWRQWHQTGRGRSQHHPRSSSVPVCTFGMEQRHDFLLCNCGHLLQNRCKPVNVECADAKANQPPLIANHTENFILWLVDFLCSQYIPSIATQVVASYQTSQSIV